jgi:hypothetical protein
MLMLGNISVQMAVLPRRVSVGPNLQATEIKSAVKEANQVTRLSRSMSLTWGIRLFSPDWGFGCPWQEESFVRCRSVAALSSNSIDQQIRGRHKKALWGKRIRRVWEKRPPCITSGLAHISEKGEKIPCRPKFSKSIID